MDTTFIMGKTNSVAYTGTAGATIASSATTTKMRIVTDSDAFYKVGANPTATTADVPIFAGIPEYIDCTPADKVSFIRSSVSGTGYMTEVSKT